MRKTDIVTQRLILKELTYDDLAFVHELNTSPLVAQYNTLSIPTNTEQTREWMSIEIEDQEDEIRHRFCWTLFLIENNTPCGLIGLKLSPRRLNFGEINYAILPQYWGNGIATEVTKSIIEFGLQTLKLRFIYAEVNNNNTRSIRVMEKAGMLPYDHSSKLLPVHNKPGNSQYLVFNAGEEL